MKRIGMFVLCIGVALAAMHGAVAEDNANNYGGGWIDGQNYGTGFEAWDINQGGGYWVPDDTDPTGFNPGIYTDNGSENVALALNYGSGYVNADRDFDVWGENFTFTIELATQWRDGGRGIDLVNSSGTPLYTFTINSSGYGDTLWGYQSDMLLQLSVLQQSDNFDVTIVGSSVLGSWTDTYTANDNAGVLAGFSVFAGDTGGDNRNALLINNMAVIPEPATAGLMVLGALGLFASRRSRKS